MNLNNTIISLPYDNFSPNTDGDTCLTLAQHLESGGVLFLPQLSFSIAPGEMDFLSGKWSDGKSKNIYLRGDSRNLRGAIAEPQAIQGMTQMLERYTHAAQTLIGALLPAYIPHAKTANTSLRCAEAAGRKSSWRKDDRRLHPDAFPSKPTHGERILRVFCNINPDGEPRTWKIGEPFADMAKKFLPKVPPYQKWQAKLLNMAGVTKSVRGEYDHIMLHLHDLVKADLDYQQRAPQLQFEFPAGSAWIVYSDQVLHAVLAGRCMLEQTFQLPQHGLYAPQTSPLSQLELLLGRKLEN
jgi:hypothetical protein